MQSCSGAHCDREKKSPVRVSAEYWVIETSSVGLFRSRKEAPEMSHLLIGAQKCTVKGPAAAPANVLLAYTYQLAGPVYSHGTTAC